MKFNVTALKMLKRVWEMVLKILSYILITMLKFIISPLKFQMAGRSLRPKRKSMNTHLDSFDSKYFYINTLSGTTMFKMESEKNNVQLKWFSEMIDLVKKETYIFDLLLHTIFNVLTNRKLDYGSFLG